MLELGQGADWSGFVLVQAWSVMLLFLIRGVFWCDFLAGLEFVGG